MYINSNKKNGLTFVETVLVLLTVSTITILGGIKLSQNREKEALFEAKEKIRNTFLFYTKKSYLEKEKKYIDIYLNNKKIEIVSFSNKKEAEIFLPRELFYEVVYDYTKKEIFTVQTTKNGNLSKAFTLYIFGKNGVAKLRISFYTFQTDKFLKINIYKNESSEKATRENIINYHYSEEGQNREGWIRESF